MRLVLDSNRCCACDECLRACPRRPASAAELVSTCVNHCPGAPCIAACPQGALRERPDTPEAESAPFGWEVTAPRAGGYCVGSLAPLSGEEWSLATGLRDAHVASGGGDPRELLSNICLDRGISLDESQTGLIARTVRADAEWGGPFGALLCDERLEEIAVVGPRKPVFVYVSGEGWKEANCRFTRLESIVSAINKLAQPLGRRITLKSPRLNGMLKDGSRMHATIPPLSEGEVTIRKFRAAPFSPAELVSRGAFSAEEMAFLWLAMQSGASLVIAGNTGSGKTSALNSLFAFVPKGERILVLEETPEIRVPHAHCCRLVAREELGLPLSELCADALRMRPDRVIVGEARDAREARALFDALLSGQARAAYATMHARTAAEACARLASLGIGASELCALDLIVVLRRAARHANGVFREERRCIEIACIAGEREGPAPLFAEGVPLAGVAQRLRECGVLARIRETFGFSDGAFARESAARASLIAGLAARTAGFGEFIAEVNAYGGTRA